MEKVKRYKLKESVEVDFTNQRKIATRIGINEVTLSNILHKKTSTTKAVAYFITILNGGSEKDIDKYFEIVDAKEE